MPLVVDQPVALVAALALGIGALLVAVAAGSVKWVKGGGIEVRAGGGATMK